MPNSIIGFSYSLKVFVLQLIIFDNLNIIINKFKHSLSI